ncbi:MAG: vesicular-fusion protein S17 [Alyxoria varia]|nr:MAG: vesicular-fusion protein S17 [Alyxoria varia]
MFERINPDAVRAGAEQALKKAQSGFYLNPWGKEKDYLKAADGFQSAGEQYRSAEPPRPHDAATCFEKAAEVERDHISEKEYLADRYWNAAEEYGKAEEYQDSIRTMEMAITLYKNAATHPTKPVKGRVHIAELHLKLGDQWKAIESFEAAAQGQKAQGSRQQGKQLDLRAADMRALEGDYIKAAQTYERAAEGDLESNSLRYGVKDLWLKAGICHMASKDMVSLKRGIESYKALDPGFVQDKEHRLLQDLMLAVESNDGEQFSEKLYLYDRTSRLTKWQTEILVRIKNRLGEGVAGGNGEEDEEDFS